MRVLVLGAGYAGVTLARKLERSLPDDVSLVVVDDTGTHVVQHEVHRVVRRPRVADHITLDLEDVLDTAEVREGHVVDVDTDANEVALADGRVLAYDVAAVCLGSETAFYGLPGVREHGIPCKRVEHALRIRESFEDALDAGGRAVVGGAGLSGVQVAGELAALREERAGAATTGRKVDAVQRNGGTGKRNGGTGKREEGTGRREGGAGRREGGVRKRDREIVQDDGAIGDSPEVVLLEMAESVAPSFPENFQAAVHDALETAGVDVHTGATVERATDDVVELADGRTFDYETFVWTGGISGPEAISGDRIDARADLRVGDSTFVVGDAGRVVDADGEAVPASAQSAIREARVAATNVERLVEHRRENAPGAFEPTLERFSFDSPGWLVSVGDDAVAQIGPGIVTGRAAVAMKASVGAGYLSGVGALQQATRLVNEELGLEPGADDR